MKVSFRSRLWSAGSKRIRPKPNRSYIIKQLLAYGTTTDLRWLFAHYSKRTITNVAKKMKSTEFHPSIHRFINLLISTNAKRSTR